MVTVEQVKEAVIDLIESKDTSVTIFFDLGILNDNRWALCLAWQDGYEFTEEEIKQSRTKMKGQIQQKEDSDWQIMGKIAYQPINSVMQEYDMDWLMPYNEEFGEVDDTEIALGENDDVAITWLFKQWERIKVENNYCSNTFKDSKWVNIELFKDDSEDFRTYLKQNNIRYEASEADNMIHYECLMNEIEIEKANRFLERE